MEALEIVDKALLSFVDLPVESSDSSIPKSAPLTNLLLAG